MLTEGKLVYDDRTSLSDYYDSDESGASNNNEWKKPKKPKKTMLDEEDRKFFTCLPTFYAIFFAFDSKDVVKSYCPFSNHNKCWQKRILWNQFWKGLIVQASHSRLPWIETACISNSFQILVWDGGQVIFT